MNMSSLDEVVDMAVREVNSYLSSYFAALRQEVLKEAPKAMNLLEAVEDYTMRGGKRLRAILALIGYWSKKWGRGDISRIAKVMAAIELLQSYLLVHDDIMDRDELRRGGPTLHVWFAKKCNEMNWHECEHYGISQAIVAGDYLEACAVFLLASTGLSAKALGDLLQAYTTTLRKVAYGQYLDVAFARTPLQNIREEDVLVVYKHKTSSYTVELPLHLGAIASEDYNEDLLRELTSFAIPAGLAFQIRDDIIGLYGDPSVTGKPAGSDVKEKKKTILVIKAYELSSGRERELLELVYDKLDSSKISLQHVEEVREIVKKTGSLSYAEELINKLVSEATSILDSAREINQQAKSVLKALTLKLAYREK